MDDEIQVKGNMQAVIEALDGKRAPFFQVEKASVFKATPTACGGWDVEDVTRKMELNQSSPSRIRGISTHLSLESLLGHVKLTGSDGLSIFADPSAPSVTAIYNYASEGWADHRAAWTCELSDEFKAWRRIDRQQMPQVTFAEHLLENMADIAEVEGSDAAGMLEAAKDLEINRDVAFAQKVDLTSGAARFKFHEDDKTAGAIVLPRKFTLAVPVFVDRAEIARIECQLRYRVARDTGVLTLGIVMLPRPERVIRDALEVALDRISNETGVTPFIGAPEQRR